MLPSKIEDFPIFGSSKRPSKFHRFWASIFYRFWVHLGLQHGTILGAKTPQNLKNGIQQSWGSPPLLVLNTIFLQNLVLNRFGLDFGGVRGRFLEDFWRIFGGFLAYFGHAFGCSCWGATPPQTPPLLTWFVLFLVRSSANFVKKIQELAEDKAENPRTCRGQSREQNPYRRLQEKSNLKASFF